jgi:CBS domain-containing protein
LIERTRVDSDPVTARPEQSVVEAADAMDSHGVGCVVVVDEEDRPVGILTDRDLTRRVVAGDRDPAKTSVGDVMTPRPVTATREHSTAEVLELLRANRIRRLPVLKDGKVVGVVSYDDLILTLSIQLWNISEAIRDELRETWRTSAKRRRRESREDAFDELRDQLGSIGGEIRERAEKDLKALLARFGRD